MSVMNFPSIPLLGFPVVSPVAGCAVFERNEGNCTKLPRHMSREGIKLHGAELEPQRFKHKLVRLGTLGLRKYRHVK
jgi:hypothetical protein